MVLCGMQRQQERDVPQQYVTQRKQSVGELLAVWLLIVAGVITAILCVRGYLGYLERGHFDLPETVIYATWMLQSTLSALGGIFCLIRSRTLVRRFLTLAALFSLVTTGTLLYQIILYGHIPKNLFLNAVVIFMGFLSLAGVLFALGRWLGRDEEHE